ncbi:MAG: hypothetical protein VR65_21965 [Desulfobulbaceae bacterium BRH_c16a]|nr:MAG: hypothetical protein VR65_21965 [Desulfobulbaceae bacterium BRH_c16a]
MKLADAITYCIDYHKINSRPNTLVNYEFIIGKLGHRYQNRHIDAIKTEEIIAFLANNWYWPKLTESIFSKTCH